MGSLSASYCRIADGQSPESVIAKLKEAATPFATKFGLTHIRFQYRAPNPWILVEGLSTRGLNDDSEDDRLLRTLMEVEPCEWISLMAHGSSSSGIYGHWVAGSLIRFLSASDCSWDEIYGTPEPWEKELLLDDEVVWIYEEKTYAPLGDSTIWDLEEHLGLPGAEIHVFNPPQDYWTIDVPLEEAFWERQRAAIARANAVHPKPPPTPIEPNQISFSRNPDTWTS